MADKSIQDIEKVIADLQAKQREFGFNLGDQIKELRDHLAVSQTSSGAISTHGLPREGQD